MRFVQRLTECCFFVSFGGSNKTKLYPKITYPNITDSTTKLIALILNEYPDAIGQESTLLKGDKIEFTQGKLQNYEGLLIKHPSETKVVIKIPELKQALLMNVSMTAFKKAPLV